MTAKRTRRTLSPSVGAMLTVWVTALAVAAGWIAWDVSRGGNSVVANASIGGPFSLTDQNGVTFTDANLKGKPTLLYFGYTFCPDVCPTSLLLMENAVEMMGPDATQKVNIVFITIDPGRDTPPVMKGYVSNFGPTIVGLTGSPNQIAAVADAYRVFYQRVPGKDGGPYLMDHSSIIYLLDRRGKFVRHFTHESKAETIAKTLQAEM